MGHFQLNSLQDMQRLNALSITEDACRLRDRARLHGKDVRRSRHATNARRSTVVIHLLRCWLRCRSRRVRRSWASRLSRPRVMATSRCSSSMVRLTDGLGVLLLVMSMKLMKVEWTREAGAEAWFRDLEGRWGFLADSFSNYYRMIIAHLGIISWQVSTFDWTLYQWSYHSLVSNCSDCFLRCWCRPIRPGKSHHTVRSGGVRHANPKVCLVLAVAAPLHSRSHRARRSEQPMKAHCKNS